MRTLGMHVANFLDLERALETSSISNHCQASVITTLNKQDTNICALVSSAHQQQTLVLRDSSGKLLDLAVKLKNLLDLRRERVKTVDDLVPAFGERDAVLGELERNHQKRDVLRGISLQTESMMCIM